MAEKKIAVVTGASRGIGRAIALELAAEGAFVIVNYNGSKEKAEEVLARIRENGGDGALYQCNVAEFDACEQFLGEVVKNYGRIDVLVNNAGITKDGLLMRMSEEDFAKVVDVNLKGTFNCIRHTSRYMLRQRSGRIINMASVVGVNGKLCGIQSRSNRSDKICRKGTGVQRDYGECCRTGIHPDGYDRCPF